MSCWHKDVGWGNDSEEVLAMLAFVSNGSISSYQYYSNNNSDLVVYVFTSLLWFKHSSYVTQNYYIYYCPWSTKRIYIHITAAWIYRTTKCWTKNKVRKGKTNITVTTVRLKCLFYLFCPAQLASLVSLQDLGSTNTQSSETVLDTLYRSLTLSSSEQPPKQICDQPFLRTMAGHA